MPPVMKVICVALLIPNSYGKVLYGFIVICANIARPCTYNVPVDVYKRQGIDAIHGNGLVSGSTIYPSPIGIFFIAPGV